VLFIFNRLHFLYFVSYTLCREIVNMRDSITNARE